KHCLFPIGDYLKSEVREIARKAGLSTAQKKDSQGICFLGKVSLADFLKQYIPEKRGIIITSDGKKIGEHDGAAFYTIGQRHGLSLGNRVSKEKSFKPLYVAEKDVATNTIVVVEGQNNQALYKKEVILSSVNFLGPIPHSLLTKPYPVMARVRYRQRLGSAVLKEEKGKICIIMGSDKLANQMYGESSELLEIPHLIFTRKGKEYPFPEFKEVISREGTKEINSSEIKEILIKKRNSEQLRK
ncbi:MAG: tRNA methyl transferase PRC-barrel domain-containing protein, partial [Patescibacteria group bacterium]